MAFLDIGNISFFYCLDYCFSFMLIVMVDKIVFLFHSCDFLMDVALFFALFLCLQSGVGFYVSFFTCLY